MIYFFCQNQTALGSSIKVQVYSPRGTYVGSLTNSTRYCGQNAWMSDVITKSTKRPKDMFLKQWLPLVAYVSLDVHSIRKDRALSLMLSSLLQGILQQPSFIHSFKCEHFLPICQSFCQSFIQQELWLPSTWSLLYLNTLGSLQTSESGSSSVCACVRLCVCDCVSVYIKLSRWEVKNKNISQRHTAKWAVVCRRRGLPRRAKHLPREKKLVTQIRFQGPRSEANPL